MLGLAFFSAWSVVRLISAAAIVESLKLPGVRRGCTTWQRKDESTQRKHELRHGSLLFESWITLCLNPPRANTFSLWL